VLVVGVFWATTQIWEELWMPVEAFHGDRRDTCTCHEMQPWQLITPDPGNCKGEQAQSRKYGVQSLKMARILQGGPSTS